MSQVEEAAGCLGTALVLVGFIALIAVSAIVALILGLIGHALGVFVELTLIVMIVAGSLFWFVTSCFLRKP